MYSRQSNKPSYLRGNHSPEGTALDRSRLTVQRESHTAGSGGSWWLQIHIPDSSPVPRPLPWCSWSDRSHTGSQSSRERLRMDAASGVLSVPPRWNCWWLSRAPRSADPSLSPSHPFCDLIWDLCTGKEGTWEAFSNRWFDSQGVFQHGSQRPLQVHWEWEVQILSRTLARKLLLSVCLAASKWEGTALIFQILPLTHTVVNESLCSFQHYAISYIRKNKLIITSFKIYSKYKEDNFKIP